MNHFFRNSSVTTRVLLSVGLTLTVAFILATATIRSYVKEKMSDHYLESVTNLFSTFEEGVRGSLERGQMKNFQRLLLQQNNINGVLMASLYNKDGTLDMSSSDNNSQLNKLPDDLFAALNNDHKIIVQVKPERIDIFAPQKITHDCLRCHRDWQQGTQGGILFFSYDTLPLKKTLNQLQFFLLLGCTGLLTLTIGLIFFIMRNQISQPVNGIIDDLTESSREVSTSSKTTAVSSLNIADHATQQAASLEEISATIEEMSGMTSQNASNAQAANGFMKETVAVLQSANKAMGRLTNAMHEIDEANKSTSKIIKTIDEIAFQTNLLALNAAVEAARAGEAGAGFAVVAEEVRNLAMRSAEAAKNTNDLLEGASDKISNGVNLVTSTDEVFQTSINKAGDTRKLIEEITNASSDQAEGITQVTIAIQELDSLTQQNAHDAEQSSQVAITLEKQVENLQFYIMRLEQLIQGEEHVSE